MIRLCLCGLCLVSLLCGAENELILENSNFTLSTPLNGVGEHVLVNYNRLRINEDFHEGDWFVTAIGDLENYLGRAYTNSDTFQRASQTTSDTPFSTQSGSHDYDEGKLYAQLYRLYGGYVDAKHRLALGLQKVSMGVGRIWNPTDLFNPKNPLALEPDEVYGVFGLSYAYSPSRLSEISVVTAQRADHSFKYAGRLKGYLGFADVGLDIVKSDDVLMIGYELEGELFDSGVELRSEGGWFEDKLLKKNFFQGLFGADYSFENSLILTGEWLHSSKTFENEILSARPSGAANNLKASNDYFGVRVGYEFDALLQGSLSQITSLDDGSYYLSPSLMYSLADDTTLAIGALLYEGKNGSEFGGYAQTYYMNIKITF